ncbi:MAG TPA: hypothetical protein VG409_00880, partial [Actinomycetota bacterium]|nr:hypothetical protein [Actinomycetota bacterium]
MAEPVLLISSDPFLGASLEAVARGRVQVARLDPAHRPPAWPAGPSTTVVLDVTARHRDSVHTWIRRHHPGPLVILLKPGERPPALPPDRARVVVSRPFRLIDLVALLERPPVGPVPSPQVADPHQAPEEEEEEPRDEGQAADEATREVEDQSPDQVEGKGEGEDQVEREGQV